MDGIAKEVNELNEKGMAIYNEARAKFADSADVQAFCKLYEKMLAGKTSEETDEKPLEVEIIPPQKQLAPAPVEKMMRDVVEVEPEPQLELCRHGYEKESAL